MPIQFCEAVDHIGTYYDGMPPAAQEQIIKNIRAIDQILPGIEQVMDISDLQIVYDQKNRHDIFGPEYRGHQGCYFWPLHCMYLADTGIRNSIAHETAHMLDMLAGPEQVEAEDKFGWKFVCSKSLYHFYLKGEAATGAEMLKYWDKETNFTGWFIFKIIQDAHVTRDNPKAQETMLAHLETAHIKDPDFNEFIHERVAHLMEEFIFTFQNEQGMQPSGVFNAKYFAHPKRWPVFWGEDWIKENEADIRLFFNSMIEGIIERHRVGSLNTRLDEFHREYGAHMPNVFADILGLGE